MRQHADVLEALAGEWLEGGPDLRASGTRRFKGGGSTTATTINYSPEEAARRAQVMYEAQRVYGATAGQAATAGYPGAVPVGASADTLAAQQLTRQNTVSGMGEVAQARNFQDQAGASLGMLQGTQANANAMGNWQNALMAGNVGYGLQGALDVQNNPYLASAMQAAVNPITQSYMDPGGVMSAIRTNAGQAGQYGGSRQGIAEGIAAGRYAQAVGDVTAKMGSDAYAKGQDTYSKTLATIPDWQKAVQGQITANAQGLGAASTAAKDYAGTTDQLATTGQTLANNLSGVGAQNENLAQQWQDYLANQRSWQLNAQWAPLQNYANIVYGQGGQGTTATTSSNTPRIGLGQVAGAGLTAASLASNFL